MRPTVAAAAILICLPIFTPACGTLQTATMPAQPSAIETPAIGAVPDAVILDAIRHSELIVLAVPTDLVPDPALSPGFQLGAKETWYNIRLEVDSVIKGRLGHARMPDYGFLPTAYTPPAPFDHLARNEIVVQYPAVTAIRSDWAAAPPPVVGEKAVFLFQRCWNCVAVGLSSGRPYRANPLVAAGWGTKLAAAEWPRVLGLLEQVRRKK